MLVFLQSFCTNQMDDPISREIPNRSIVRLKVIERWDAT